MRLLLIEDETDLRESLAQALREDGYAVDAAADGVDGLHKALSNSYNAILLDYMIPGMDGRELLRRLREDSKTPVMMLTARDSVRDRVDLLDVGADDYVVKPFDLDELLARVRALIRRAAQEASSQIKVRGAIVDTASRTVHKDGTQVALTGREYALVEYLALHAGAVVTRTELYDHMFDETDSSMSNLLDVHVSNIRRKLGASFITTRRGHGYSIEQRS